MSTPTSEDMDAIGDEDAACQRLRQIPGVGLIATAASVAACVRSKWGQASNVETKLMWARERLGLGA